ncbi:MAG: 30S ribosomal protein S3 [Candidatus Bathyarchaeia archaeon]
MSIVKRFITEAIKNAEIDEFLLKRLERAGYGGVNLSKTPLGTHVVVYAMRPGLVIGRGGETIKELASVLEEKFGVSNPQISVSEIEVPELNAYVVASRVTSALQKGIHFRRAGFWALNQVMEAGALGCEIVISGKLRTERARFEKFRAGYFPRCGEPALKYMRKTEAHVQLKPGMFGVKVKIMPPDAQFPDKIKIVTELPPELAEKKPEETAPAPEQKPAEQPAPATEEKPAVAEEKKPEAEAPATPAESAAPPAPAETPAQAPAPAPEAEQKPAETKPEEAPK